MLWEEEEEEEARTAEGFAEAKTAALRGMLVMPRAAIDAAVPVEKAPGEYVAAALSRV